MRRTSYLRLVTSGTLLLCLVFAAIGQEKAAGEIELFRCWKFASEEAAGRVLSADPRLVFSGTADGGVEALSADGKKIWASEFGGETTSDLVSIGNLLLFVTTASGSDGQQESTLRAVSRETGVTVWTKQVPPGSWHRSFAYKGSILVVAETGSIQLLGSKDGSSIWERTIARAFSARPAVAGDRLVLATPARQLFVISLDSGQILSLRTSPYIVSSIAAADTSVFLGDERGGLSLLPNSGEKPKWKFRAGGEISFISLAGDHILALSHDNFVYFLDAARGGLNWKRRLTGRAFFAAELAGRYAVTTVPDSHSVTLIDLINGRAAGQIVLGPDEVPTVPPATSNGLIYVLTDKALYAYSPGPCTTKNGSAGN